LDKATGQPRLSGSDLKETLGHWSGPLIEPLLDINPSIPQVAPHPESSWPCACVTPVVKRRHGDAEELSKIGWREQVVVVHGLPLELVVLTLVNSSHEYSRVEAVDAAVAADPRFRYENLDGQRVLVRSDAGPGNALNYRVRNQPDQPPELTFFAEYDQFQVEVVITASGASPRPAGITISPLPGQEALDPSAFAALRLRGLLGEMNDELRSPFLRHLVQRSGASGWLEPFLETPKPGRRGRDDVEYAIWADRYVEAVQRASRNPIVVLTREYPGHSADSLRAILNKARKRGLLSKSQPGRSGGHLLPKAIKLLEENHLAVTSQGV